MACTPRQYRSHIERKRGCPPRSHSLIVTFPLVTLRMLKPTVGIMSSEKPPVCAPPHVSGGRPAAAGRLAACWRCVGAHRNDVDERRLPRVLQADECQLHLLLEEETV